MLNFLPSSVESLADSADLKIFAVRRPNHTYHAPSYRWGDDDVRLASMLNQIFGKTLDRRAARNSIAREVQRASVLAALGIEWDYEVAPSNSNPAENDLIRTTPRYYPALPKIAYAAFLVGPLNPLSEDVVVIRSLGYESVEDVAERVCTWNKNDGLFIPVPLGYVRNEVVTGAAETLSQCVL